jgi:hypothetical protein
MTSEETTTAVAEQDLAFVESLFERTPRPLTARELAEKLAFEKTASQRTQDVKLYDPACSYDVGDQVYKEYDEALMVSSKTVEPFKGAVVLRVIGKAFFKAYDCEMLEVDFAGGGVFRKYVDYMKKTKTQVLLPSSMSGEGRPAPFMAKDHDPRLTELPMTDRDLRALEKSLRAALAKSPKFFGWNDAWQLAARRVEIPDDKIQALEEALRAKGKSAATEELVRDVFAVETSSDLFDIHCLSLNYALGKKHKKEFLFVSPLGWGKWLIKSVIVGLPKGLPLAAPLAPFPELDETAVTPPAPAAFPLKVYLSWREILSGGIKIPRCLHRELSHAQEFVFTVPDENKSYTVYFYPGDGYVLGLKDYFLENNVPQGTCLTLERKSPSLFHFWLKKEKKKLEVVRLSYDPDLDQFKDEGEDVYSYLLPNKSIYLDRETLTKLLALTPQREGLDLKALLILVFKTLGQEGTTCSLHYMRAYHLVDVLKHTNQEDVERVLAASPEFAMSDKKKGIFFYYEARPAAEEIAAEAAGEASLAYAAEAFEAGLGPEAFPGAEASGLGIGVTGGEEEEEELPGPPPRMVSIPAAAPVAAPPPEKARPEPRLEPKKEKVVKKKKVKPEGDKAPRLRKSERKVIEERLEIEESAQEALTARKAVEDEEGAAPVSPVPAKDKEAVKVAAAPAEKPSFGIFAEKLKTALSKKKDEPAKDDEPKKET